MTSKGGVGQNVIAAFGPIVSAVVGAVVTVLLTTPLDRGADTLAGMAMKALPRLVLGVAAGVATFFAIRLLTFLGRKVRPWFRRPATKLKALAPEIERLFDYDGDQLELMLLKNDLSLTRYYRRCDELKAKLSKIGIPAPPRGGVPYWISLLASLSFHPVSVRHQRGPEGGEKGGKGAAGVPREGDRQASL